MYAIRSYYVVHDQEPERVRGGAHDRAEEVDADRYLQSQRGEQNRPGPREHDKEGIPGRVWNAEDVARCDILARIPERGGA